MCKFKEKDTDDNYTSDHCKYTRLYDEFMSKNSDPISMKDYLFNMKKSIDMVTDEDAKNKLMKYWYKLIPSIIDENNNFLKGNMLGIATAINILLHREDEITTMNMYIDSLDK